MQITHSHNLNANRFGNQADGSYKQRHFRAPPKVEPDPEWPVARLRLVITPMHVRELAAADRRLQDEFGHYLTLMSDEQSTFYHTKVDFAAETKARFEQHIDKATATSPTVAGNTDEGAGKNTTTIPKGSHDLALLNSGEKSDVCQL